MKTQKQWLALAVFLLAAAAVVGLAVYREPLTLEQLYPEIDLEGCEGMHLTARVYPNDGRIDDGLLNDFSPDGEAARQAALEESRPYTYDYTLTAGAPGFDQMMALLSGEFQRVPLPAPSSRSHTIRTGDVEWRVSFGKQYQYAARLENWFGDLSVYPDGGRDGDRISQRSRDWTRQVFDLIQQYCPQEAVYRGIIPADQK